MRLLVNEEIGNEQKYQYQKAKKCVRITMYS